MKFSDFIRAFGRRTIIGLSLPEVERSKPSWFRALSPAASSILLAAPLRAEFVYVPNEFDNDVSAYTVGSNGALTPVSGSPFATGNAPYFVTVEPSGRFVHTANAGDDTVSAFSIGSNGALTSVSGSPFATGSTPYSATADPSGRFVYTTNFGDNTISAFSVGANGALTPVSGSPFAAGNSPISVTVDPTGRFAYVANENDNSVSAYTIGPSGNLVPFAGLQFPRETWPLSVTVDPTGTYLYVGNGGSNSMVYSIGANGALTPVSASSFTFAYAVATTPIVPFAWSTTNFETETGTPATFTLSDSFTLGKNSTGIDPVTERVIMRIGTFAVTIPPATSRRRPRAPSTSMGLSITLPTR